MTDQLSPPLPQLGEDDKLTPLMVYTSHFMAWGPVFSKQAIRVSTWLFSDMAPTYIKIYNAQVLMIGGAHNQPPIKLPVMYLQTSGINAYHVMPPSDEGADYDPEEPNRKMIPTTALLGYFRFDGFSRMAEFTTMDNYLGAAKSEFITLYDITMTCPLVPSIKGVQAPMALLRQERVTFSVEED